MKYKVGDKVKIHGVADHRKRYNVKVVTIMSTNPNSEFNLAPHYGVGECFIFYENELVPVFDKKIVITIDGTETLARLYDGNKVIKTATAKCSPDDTFDFETGAKVAFERLIGEAKKPYDPPKCYNGKVVCVNTIYPWWTVGKVYPVVNGKIKDNRGKVYPVRDGDVYKDAEDVRHAGDNEEKRRHNSNNEFIPFVE